MIYFAVFLLVISVILLVNCVELLKSVSFKLYEIEKKITKLEVLDDLDKNITTIQNDVDGLYKDLDIVRKYVLNKTLDKR